MQQYLRDQVDWPQAFPAEEYAARRAKLRSALAAADIDAIYVTLPADLTENNIRLFASEVMPKFAEKEPAAVSGD